MKSLIGRCAIIAACLLPATSRASGGPPGDDTRTAPGRAGAAQAMGPVQGLSAHQRQDLFHVSEGIELVPLAWIKALKSIKTNRPFLEIPERFGLIADPANTDHLPIGITASPSRGAEFLGPMVGVNCAACHVGAVTFKGRNMPLLGGPNLFDLNAFYNELFSSLGVTLKDDASRGQFLADLTKQGDVEAAILMQQLGAAAVGASQLGGRT